MGFGSAEFTLIIVALALAFPLTIACFAIYMKSRQRQMWHETARLALEKGQPMPPLPAKGEWPRHRRERREKNDIRAGLVLLAVGGGLYVFFWALGTGGMAAVGAIPGFIGIALLLFGIGNALFGTDKTSTEDRPPQP